MPARQRQARILAELRGNGAIRVSELTEHLAVSDITIRRDLGRLAAAGLVEKVHGGAVLVERTPAEVEVAVEAGSSSAERALADAAIELVSPGSSVAVSAGPAMAALAERLAKIPRLTVVTNSTPVADRIAAGIADTQSTVLVTGGVRTPGGTLVGPPAEAALRTLSVDHAFVGVRGIAVVQGLTVHSIAEASVNRQLIARARQTIVLAESSAWARHGLAGFADLDAIDVLISDSLLTSEAASALNVRGVEVRVVGCDASVSTQQRRALTASR